MSGIVRNKIGGVAGAHSRVVHVLGKSSTEGGNGKRYDRSISRRLFRPPRSKRLFVRRSRRSFPPRTQQLLQIASEVAMTGLRLSAQETLDFHLINKISKSQETVVEEAVKMAKKVVTLSPDAIFVTRAGLRETW